MVDGIAVSVIIPLYNRGEYIKRAIDSVFRQTCQNFEIIVVDGHSTDEGPAIVKNFHDPRIIFVEQEGQGVSAARNQGVDRAKNDFIAFLDADDEWSCRHLEVLVKLREKFPEAGLFVTAYVTVSNTMESRKVILQQNFKSIPPPQWEGLIPNFFQSGIYDIPFTTSCVGMTKNLFIEAGGFPLGVQWGEDKDLWFRIALKYRIAFSWNGETIWHQEASNRISNSLNFIPYEREPVVTQALDALKSNSVSSTDAPFLKEFIANCELNRALWIIKTGNPEKARKILKDCETSLFFGRKIRLLFFSYIPHPIFTFFWKTTRIIKQNLFNRDYSKDPWLK
jgi:glycosyltransferase involved in cell wall biosynthesis